MNDTSTMRHEYCIIRRLTSVLDTKYVAKLCFIVRVHVKTHKYFVIRYDQLAEQKAK